MKLKTPSSSAGQAGGLDPQLGGFYSAALQLQLDRIF
jgi:hypothetical protein